MKVHFGPGSELRIHGASVLEITGIVEPPPPPQVFHAGCDFDDCTLDAAYCVGHALELAQVSAVDEAPAIRGRLVDVVDRFEALLRAREGAGPFELVDVWGQLVGAVRSAQDVLKRYPQ